MSELAKKLGVDLLNPVNCACGNGTFEFHRELMSSSTQLVCVRCGARGPRGPYQHGAIHFWNRLRGE